MTAHSRNKAGGREVCFGKHCGLYCLCIPPTSLLQPAVPPSQRGDLFHKTPWKAHRFTRSSRRRAQEHSKPNHPPASERNTCTTGYVPCPAPTAQLTKAFLGGKAQRRSTEILLPLLLLFSPCHRKKQRHQQRAFILCVI